MFLASPLALGVGRSRASLPRFRACPFPVIGWPFSSNSFDRAPPLVACPPIASATLGVCSNDEQPGALVRGSDIGRSNNSPPDIHPQDGKVGKDCVKPKSKVP